MGAWLSCLKDSKESTWSVWNGQGTAVKNEVREELGVLHH